LSIESDVAAAIIACKADAGMGIKTVAVQNGLDFIPLRAEEYDFVIRKDVLDRPSAKAFLDILRSEPFEAELGKLGYRLATE
jgi:putative molybdopterin biosynthesis protein